MYSILDSARQYVRDSRSLIDGILEEFIVRQTLELGSGNATKAELILLSHVSTTKFDHIDITDRGHSNLYDSS